MSRLIWPSEFATKEGNPFQWFHNQSNICLDFHGDPCRAQLVVFSDGNHHMALMDALQAFKKHHPKLEHIFYATTPPNNLVQAMKAGAISIGNLVLSVQPHAFIGPEKVLDQLVEAGQVEQHRAFMKSQGNVLLVPRGNPKGINGLKDLLRKDVRLFSPNPAKETVSYQVYFDSLIAMAEHAELETDAFEQMYATPGKVYYGECIHHREAPLAVADGHADVALIYYHLALRYTRIFPSVFDYIYLGRTPANTLYHPSNVISYYHVGVVGQGGLWGQAFEEFMFSDDVTRIYDHHGLYRPDKFA